MMNTDRLPFIQRLSREELGKNRVYRFAGKIYHDGIIGTIVRLEYRMRYLTKRIRKGSVRAVILFHPDKPDYSQVLYKICNSLGCAMTSSTGTQPDLIIAFQDTTRRPYSPLLAEIAADNFVVNERCDDVSKVKVEEVFQEVFGYGTFVNPETYLGRCVMKSNENAMHDGVTVECPTTPTGSDVVYQKLINNVAGNEVLDVRVPVIGETMPFAYLKYRRLRSRFSNWNSRVTMDSVDSVFTSDELTRIKQFTEKLGLDFGELDILRDNDDGQIYIVDVNNTPCGPPNHLGKSDAARAMQLLSSTFNTEFLARKTDSVAHRGDVR
jgi:hypothetical protein